VDLEVATTADTELGVSRGIAASSLRCRGIVSAMSFLCHNLVTFVMT
jgi:hypothetical protein